MRNGPQYLCNGAAKRCAICDGKFGLIRYYSWRTALCSRKCAARFQNARRAIADGYLGFKPSDMPPDASHPSANAYCFALGAPHEIHPGEWQNAAPKALLRVLLPADRSRLPARNRDAPHLLRSRLLRRTLQKRVRASRKAGNGIMSARQPSKPNPWPGSPDEHRCSRRKGHCDESL
jgi:hypothetical protein